MEFNLLKLADSGYLRKLLRNNGNQIQISSLYEVNNDTYVVLYSKTPIKNAGSLSGLCVNLNKIEEVIFTWAKSEIEQSVEFIVFESRTQLGNNGRELLFENVKITRSFKFLTEIYAILNFTLDSFSDGGKIRNIDDICNNALTQINYGASILDIGVESTNPNSIPILAEDEINKLRALLPELIALKKMYGIKISIDTYHDETIKWLIDKDIDIINDVSGNIPITTVGQLIANNKKYIAMHSLTIPANRNTTIAIETNPVAIIKSWMLKKINKFTDNQIDLDSIILDPGIGFGNTPAQAWFILRNFTEFLDLPCEVLLGHSRKSFFTHITPKEVNNRELETMMVALRFINKVDYLRLHDVGLIKELYPIINQLDNKIIKNGRIHPEC